MQVSAVTDASFDVKNNFSKHAGWIFWLNSSGQTKKEEIYYKEDHSIDSNEAELKSIHNALKEINNKPPKMIWLFTDNMNAVNFLKGKIKNINDKYINIVKDTKKIINQMKTTGTKIDISWKKRNNEKIKELNKRVS